MVKSTSDSFHGINLTRVRFYEQVADQIQNIIIQGRLMPGDKMPSERQLTKDLGVSRTVIREAVRVLQERGLVNVMCGTGTYVSRANAAAVSQSLSLFMQRQPLSVQDLIDTRLPLEMETATLAAKNATEEDIVLLKSVVSDMRNMVPLYRESDANLEQLIRDDLLFHQTIARASKNPIMSAILISVTDLLYEIMLRSAIQPGSPEAGLRDHQEILDAICRRDSTASRRLMRRHLCAVNKWALSGNES